MQQQRLTRGNDTPAQSLVAWDSSDRGAFFIINKVDSLDLIGLLVQKTDDKRFHWHQTLGSFMDGSIDLFGIKIRANLITCLIQDGEPFSGRECGLIQARVLKGN